MATKNPIAQIYRIMKVPQIPCVKSALQNCMGQVNQDRVGVISIQKPSKAAAEAAAFFCGYGKARRDVV